LILTAPAPILSTPVFNQTFTGDDFGCRSALVSKSIDQLCVDTIRLLAVDMVERANSGHPGMPLGAAPMAYVLWDRFLVHNPANPAWFDRDRFVLSAGHGSALLYSLLHVYGYDLSIADLQNFRQWGGKTAGHPERGLAPGVECTTGPLGQGFAMGVGMALAESHLNAVFDEEVVDHHTYAIVSDGDLMEGVSGEAASLAGTLKLGKLVYLYDDNGITIEGPTSLAFTEDVAERFDAYGWQVLAVEDGNDLDEIEAAIAQARADEVRPSLIRVRTHIGYGSPKQDSEKSHGEPLGPDAAAATRKRFGWEGEEPFHVPEPVRDYCSAATQRGKILENEWGERCQRYQRSQPEQAALLATLAGGGLPEGWSDGVPSFKPGDGPIATRAASGKVINGLATGLPTLLGGSADLAPSNKTLIDGEPDFGPDDRGGRNVRFGVREHAMAAIVNGMALHGGVFPYGGTFLVFADYLRPALRLAALMQTRSIFVFTHDSIGVGEDGPTHQPVEHLASLRAIPGLTVFRPADAGETTAVWRLAVDRGGPCAIALSRQKLPVLGESAEVVARGVATGAYILAEPAAAPELVLVATGSEVHLALAAAEKLADNGVPVRVVSMPSQEVFFEQAVDYRASVLPPEVPKLAIEAGVSMGWREVVGDGGAVIAIDRFGESAPGATVMDKLGFNVDNVVAQAERLLGEPA
jgi:transketolase